MSRLAGTLAVVAVLATAALGGPGNAITRPAEAAEGCDGVWVVVDASALEGPVTTRCAAGAPGSGLEALAATGHAVTPVQGQPFVCQIDGHPDSTCQRIPPADAYWSYWHAETGGTWTYSTEGAATRTPTPGSVEGWAFGSGDPPSLAPPPTPEPESEPAPPSEPAPADAAADAAADADEADQQHPASGADTTIALRPGDPRLPPVGTSANDAPADAAPEATSPPESRPDTTSPDVGLAASEPTRWREFGPALVGVALVLAVFAAAALMTRRANRGSAPPSAARDED